jgi:serine protease
MVVPQAFGRRTLLRGGAALTAAAATGCALPDTQPATTDNACFLDRVSLIGGDQENCLLPKGTLTDLAWHLHAMRVPQAWNLRSSKRRFGEGVTIGHIDTGVARHKAFDDGGVLWERGYDFVDDVPYGYDPLIDHIEYLEQIGHGTATASVIISRGKVSDAPWKGSTCGGTDAPGRIVGVARAAQLIPVRAFRFAATSRLDRVTEAIRYLTVKEKADVITMALGWPFSNADMTAAIKAAIDADILVLAAAGNIVSRVAFPANARDVIAVGGTGPDDIPWCGSSRGSTVTVSAPGDKVWRAYRDEKSLRLDLVGPRYGTSYSVSLTAGVAALWLAHHGRAALNERKARRNMPNLQELFRAELTETAWQPKGWDQDRLGAGIVDAEGLLLGRRRTT